MLLMVGMLLKLAGSLLHKYHALFIHHNFKSGGTKLVTLTALVSGSHEVVHTAAS